MDSILTKLVAALIGALLCWLIAKYYNRSRLYCAPSRLYEYSSLVDGSSTVQLVIANRGRKTEESVEIQLSTDYEYHLLAATQNGMEIPKEKVIRLSALLPKSEVSLIVVAEGRPRFSKDGIRSIRSKSAKGTVAASLTEAEASSPGAAVAAIFVLLVIAVFGYGFGKTIGEDVWGLAEDQLSPVVTHDFSEGCVSVLSNGEKVKSNETLTEEQLKAFALAATHVKSVTSREDILFVEVEIENLIEGPVEYSLTLKSHASDSTTETRHRRNSFVYNIVMLGKDEKRKYSLSDFFPEDRRPKRFWLEARVEIAGYWITVTRSFFFGPDASLTCPSGA